MSCTLIAAFSFESRLGPPLALGMALPLPLPFPLPGAAGSSVTVPSAVRTPQPGRVGGGGVRGGRGVRRGAGGGGWDGWLAGGWRAVRGRRRVLDGRRGRLPGGRLPRCRRPVGLVYGCDRPLLGGRNVRGGGALEN